MYLYTLYGFFHALLWLRFDYRSFGVISLQGFCNHIRLLNDGSFALDFFDYSMTVGIE